MKFHITTAFINWELLFNKNIQVTPFQTTLILGGPSMRGCVVVVHSHASENFTLFHVNVRESLNLISIVKMKAYSTVKHDL